MCRGHENARGVAPGWVEGLIKVPKAGVQDGISRLCVNQTSTTMLTESRIKSKVKGVT